MRTWGTIVLAVSDDEYPMLSANIFVQSIPSDIEVIRVDKLQNILDYNYPTFVFAHGDENVLNYNGEFIQWDSLSQMVSKFENKLYLISCNSNSIQISHYRSNILGFTGNIDAYMGGYIAASLVLITTQDVNTMISVLDHIYQRQTELDNGEKALNLAYSESTYQLAVKREYKSSSKWGVTYYKENIAWVNADHSTCVTYLAGSLIRGTITSIFVYLGWAGPVALLIATLFALHATTVVATSLDRWRGDCKAGIGGVLIPVPAVKFWYHIDSGKFYIPIPDPSGILLYNSIGLLSKSWTPVPLP